MTASMTGGKAGAMRTPICSKAAQLSLIGLGLFGLGAMKSTLWEVLRRLNYGYRKGPRLQRNFLGARSPLLA